MLKSFKEYLKSNSVNISGEDKITVSFEYGDLKYLFVFDDSDPFYFRLILPNIASVENDNTQKIYEVVNSINVNYKVVKATVFNNNVWISVEEFVYSKENINELFKRSIELLKTIIANFKEEIQKDINHGN